MQVTDTGSSGSSGVPANGTPAQDPSSPASPSEGDLAASIGRLEIKYNDAMRRLGKMAEEHKSLVERVGAAQTERVKPQGPTTHDDLMAAMKLGGVRAKMPDAARTALDEMISAGTTTLSDALRWGEFFLEFGGAKPAEDGGATPSRSKRNAEGDAPAPTGKAATAAQRTQVEYPRTQYDWLEIKTKANGGDAGAKARWDALMSDPDFDPSELTLRRSG